MAPQITSELYNPTGARILGLMSGQGSFVAMIYAAVGFFGCALLWLRATVCHCVPRTF